MVCGNLVTKFVIISGRTLTGVWTGLCPIIIRFGISLEEILIFTFPEHHHEEVFSSVDLTLQESFVQ